MPKQASQFPSGPGNAGAGLKMLEPALQYPSGLRNAWVVFAIPGQTVKA